MTLSGSPTWGTAGAAVVTVLLLAACTSRGDSGTFGGPTGAAETSASSSTSTAAEPSTTATTTATTSPPPTTSKSTPSSAGPQVLRVGQRASFSHFTVLVQSAEDSEAQGFLVRATVCVTSLPPAASGGKTRLSWDPWSIQTSNGSHGPRLYDASHPPPSLYPMSGTYAAGACASGTIPFADGYRVTTRVIYRNELGDRAEWPVSSSPGT